MGVLQRISEILRVSAAPAVPGVMPGDIREVRSEGALPDIPEWSFSRWWGGGSPQTYEMIWRAQPWVRTAVDFLARNIAQVGLHVYRREGEGEEESRIRLRDHPFARILTTPDPDNRPPITHYGLIYAIVQDLGVHGNAFLQKVPSGDPPFRLVRLRPQRIRPPSSADDMDRLLYTRNDGRTVSLDTRRLIWIRYLSPLGSMGESPIESLRLGLLDEYFEAAGYRQQLWRNGARVSGWIDRPLEAPEWSDLARQRFEQDWRAHWTGHSDQAGGTPVLEDGMKFHKEVFSAEEAQYLETRKLSREEVASAFFIPPTMLGVTQGATYSNTRQHHQMLYQDTLGPVMRGIEEDLEQQLLPDLERWTNVRGVYCQFNIAAKLAGDFEEQSSALSTSTGRPWMTANEARTRLNLPRLEGEGYDQLVTPLNVLVGGQASPTDAAPPAPEAPLARRPRIHRPAITLTKSNGELSARMDSMSERLRQYFARQQRSLEDLGEDIPLVELWDGAAWDRELSGEMLRHMLGMASLSAHDFLEQWDPSFAWSDDPLIGWLANYSGSAAAATNIVTHQRLTDAWLSPERIALLAALWAWCQGSRPGEIAQTSLTAARNFGAHDAAKATGLRYKIWRVGSDNPRPTHAALDGERVPVSGVFSNGARWPGDQILSIEERAGCRCALEFTNEED